MGFHHLVSLLSKDHGLLARSARRRTWLLHNFRRAARCNGWQNIPQLKSGDVTWAAWHGNCEQLPCQRRNGGPALVKGGKTGYPALKNDIDGVIPGPQGGKRVHRQISHGRRLVRWWVVAMGGRGPHVHHPLHHPATRMLTCKTGLNMKRGIEAHRKMDFVLAKAQFMTTQAMYSDIVLPRDHPVWEVPGGLWLRTSSAPLLAGH